MLEYAEPWGNSSQMMLTNSDEVPQVVGSGQNSNNHVIDMFNTNDSSSSNNNNSHGHHSAAVSLDYAHANFSNNNAFVSQHQFFNGHQAADHHQTSNLHNQLYVDPRAFSSSYAPHHHFDNPLAGLNINSGAGGGGGGGYFLVPKTEEGVGRTGTRIGLNLGHRTYFSAQDDDFVNRLYRRSRPGGFDGAGSVNSPRCQAESCAADLSNAKHYHRRHKVCEFHSKAATVIAGGLTQRFCQQCSRFHLLTEFDNGKRSCRKRLADHNRRRRKTPQLPTSQSLQLEHHEKSPVETSFNNLDQSPPESSAMTHSSSSVTIAISPPRMTLECFRQRSYRDMASASSSSSVFYSN